MTKEQKRDARQRIKDRLKQYTFLRLEYYQIQQERERIELEAFSISSPNNAGQARGGGISKPTEQKALALVQVQELLQVQLEKLAAAQLEIEETIEGLEPVERALLRYRYLDGLTWESVCVAMSYSWRQVHNIHGQALDRLAERGDGSCSI